MKQDKHSINFSQYDTVFCDSLEALQWVYKKGLPESATVKSSEPAMLWDGKKNIHNIESRWTAKELDKFQSTISELTENVFDAALSVTGIERELALAVSQFVYQFQKLLYKAACLDEYDFTEPRLFIYVDGKTGPSGNMMNSPWDQLLQSNSLFSMVNYKLKDDDWKVLNTQGISYWQRFKVAGYETVIYRMAEKLMKNLPDWIFTKKLLMPNENELNIEIAASLALRGVKVSKVELDFLPNIESIVLEKNIISLCDIVSPIIRKRVEYWVTPSAVEVTMELFQIHLKKQLKQFKSLINGWEKVIKKECRMKRVMLANAPGSISGIALSYVCRKSNIVFCSSQHGITREISKEHNMLKFKFDSGLSDAVFSYNHNIANTERNTFFAKSNCNIYVVGAPLRLIRMNNNVSIVKNTSPIVYIATHFYGKGFSTIKKTDYILAKEQQKLIVSVLSKLPHKVDYKTYPMDNRRNADIDPVLIDVDRANNMEVFLDKVDMRYLISRYNIFVTTCATSTIGWVVMSGKPVVFINQKNNHPLTDDAYVSFSKGLFIFNDDDKNFHSNIRVFLSQSNDEIEKLWQKKKNFRAKMIKDYFSEYKIGGAGKRAAKIILREYFN